MSDAAKAVHRSTFGALSRDARHMLRSLRRTPGFTLVAILTLTLGIGVTTTIVSVVDHVLLRSLPFYDAGRLMMLLERGDRGGLRGPSAPTTADWKRDPAAAQAFDGLTFVRGDGATLAHGDASEPIAVAYVEPDFFPIVGARPTLGRLLTADDHRPDAPAVAVLSFDAWQRSFGGDPAVVGRRVLIDSIPTTIVGIMPLGGTYPGFASVWQPLSHYRHQEILMQRGLHADSRTIARLKPGVDSARAAALMRTADARLAAAYPEDQAHWHIAMVPIRADILGGVGPTLYTLAAAAIAVLLLTCANVANLLLARVASRSRELAQRSALGA
jgi:putative ABC transport system permease protein